MKKALVVGGSNGIGLAIANLLIKQGYYVIILDQKEVIADSLPAGKFEYAFCDLLESNDALFEALAEDQEIDFLMITAGFGRVANFEYLHLAEIQNIFQVNTIAGIRIIRHFYSRISAKKRFYCGMMASIAGLMSSPLFSVYAASKAALCRFIESINIELEMKETKNRILNISPSSIPGTRFNGGPNQLDQLESLAEEIVVRILKAEELYIPKYQETFKSVLERYHKDPHEYGLHSYKYKLSSGRFFNEARARIALVTVSANKNSIDLFKLFKDIHKKTDYLMVKFEDHGISANPEDDISSQDKEELIKACRYVDRLISPELNDKEIWEKYNYQYYYITKDLTQTVSRIPEDDFFKEREIKVIYL